MFLLHPNHPPITLERTTDTTGSEIFKYGFAEFLDTSPQVDTQGTGISLSVDSANRIITASEDLFTIEDVNTIWKIGGPSIDDYPGGTFINVENYLSPTKIEYKDQWYWPVDENDWGTDATDWCGPFEKTDVTFTGTGWVGGSTWVNNVSNVVFSDNRPVDNNLLGLFVEKSLSYVIVGVFPDSNTITLLRLNGIGQSEPQSGNAYIYKMGNRRGVTRPYFMSVGQATSTSLPPTFQQLLSNDGVVMSSGGDFLPTNHEDFFDGDDGSLQYGGAVFSQGGVGKITAKNGDGSYDTKQTQPRSHVGPSFRLGIGMSKGAGFPSVGVNHQGRTVLAGYQGKYSESITISKSKEPLDFGYGANNAGDGILLKAMGEGAVNWVDSNRDLLVGTELAEFKAPGEPITPESAVLLKTSAYGGKRIMPVRMGASTVFVGRDGRSLYQSSYKDQEDTYNSIDLTDMADHLFVNERIAQIVMVSQPDVLLWVRFDSGKMCYLNWKPASDVMGWSSFKSGNTTSTADSNVFNWISALPSLTAGETHDNLWTVVDRRTNASNTYKAIEAFGRIYTMDQEATYTISSTVESGSDGATLTMARVSHLAGQTVQLIADGVYLGEGLVDETDKTISLDAYMLPSTTTSLTIGRKVFFELAPMVLETSVGRSPTHGMKRNYSRILVYVQNTRGLKVEQYGIDTVPAASPTQSVPALGGWVDVPVLTDYGTHPTITITQEVPYQIEVSAVNAEVSFGD